MSMPKRWYGHDDAARDFAYHPATGVTGPVHDAVRQATGAVAHRLVELLPEGPAKTTAINKLREAMMWANAAVATQHDPIWEEEVGQLRPIPPLIVQEPINAMRSEEVAELLHEQARKQAAAFGARNDPDVGWHDLPPNVSALMTAMAAAVLHRDEPDWVKQVRRDITPDPGPVEQAVDLKRIE